MLKVTSAFIIVAVTRICLANFDCGDDDLDATTVVVNVSAVLEPVNGYYTPIARVDWQVANPRDATLGGFAIKINSLHSNDVTPSLLPIDQCHSGFDHVWVITDDVTNCERNSSVCASTDDVTDDACLCARDSCPILTSSTECSGFWNRGQGNFDFTVLRTTQTTDIPILFDVAYNVTVMPYYRGNVGISPGKGTLRKINACDEVIFEEIRNVVKGKLCIDIIIARPENVSTNDPTKYEIEFKPSQGGSSTDRTTTVTFYTGNASLDIRTCGLDYCQEYHVTVYIVVGGSRGEVLSTFNHTTSSPFEDGSLIAPITTSPTTTPSTIAGPSAPNATSTTITQTQTQVPTTGDPPTPEGFLCSSAQINGYTFPKQQPGLVSYSLEKCENDKTTPLASITCSKSLKRFDFATFQNSTCESIEEIVAQNITNSTLEKLQIATANVTILTTENVTMVAEFYGNISQLNRSFSEKEVGEAAEIASHLTEFYRQGEVEENAAEKQNLVRSLTRISRKIVYDFTATPSVSKLTNEVNIEVREVPQSAGYTGYEFNATFYGDKDANFTFNPISIKVPAEALTIADEKISAESVISSELGDSVNAVERINLTSDSLVTITDHSIEEVGTKRLTDFKDEYSRLECVFWNFEIGKWSSEGCFVSSQSSAACQCNHLTNFAILVSRFEIPSDVTLSVVTYIGCGLSIIGLLTTLLVICMSKKLRNRYQMRILGNICLCLALALMLFVFGVGSQVDTVHCTVLTVFMHFFFLAAWFWTAVYSYTLYRDIVQIFPSGPSFKLRYAAVFAYGLPLVIVLLNSTIALVHIDDGDFLADPLIDSSYRARNFCWLNSNSLYFGFLLTVGILLLFNIAVFCKVVPKVTCRKSIQSSKANTGIGRQVATILALVTTMGLSWIFGFLMLVSDNHTFLLAMSWLFTIVNVFQGIFIFYFTAVRSGELRQLCAPINRRFGASSTISTGVSSSEVRT